MNGEIKMINRVILVGRLTKNPELRYTPNGVAVANFTLAVNRPYSNQQGEKEADFIPVVVWKSQAENAAKYLVKGSLAGVDGRIQTRNFENNEGKRQYVTEVVADSVQFLEPKKDGNGNGNKNQSNQTSNRQSGQFNEPFPGDNGYYNGMSDDDLPY